MNSRDLLETLRGSGNRSPSPAVQKAAGKIRGHHPLGARARDLIRQELAGTTSPRMSVNRTVRPLESVGEF